MTNKDITGGEVEPISRATVELRVLQREHFADSNAGLAAFIRVEAALHFLNLASKGHLKTTGDHVKPDNISADHVKNTGENEHEDGVDLTKCPKCNGPADNGHDRCFPPNPYNCTKCEGSGEWRPISEAPRENGTEILAIIRGCDSSKLKRVPLVMSEDGWLFDGSELSNAWDVIKWLPMPPLPAAPGERG